MAGIRVECVDVDGRREQLLADFPYLTHEDILACLSYAAEREHRMLVANE